MQNPDWSKAPEDATHYGPHVDGDWLACWHKWENGKLMGWLAVNDHCWERTPRAETDKARKASFIERPV